MCLNKYCTVLMNLSLNLYLYQCFNIGYSMTVTMILKLVHTLLYPSISYCAHVKKYNNISRSSSAPGPGSMLLCLLRKYIHATDSGRVNIEYYTEYKILLNFYTKCILSSPPSVLSVIKK